MTRNAGTRRVVVLCLTAALSSKVILTEELTSPRLLPAGTQSPSAPSGYEYIATSISALSFSGRSYNPVSPLARASVLDVDQHFYATLNIPAGAVIDEIILNNANDGVTPYVMGVALWLRDTGSATFLAGFSTSPHTIWTNDGAGPALGIVWYGDSYASTLILDVEVAASSNYQYFGYVTVYWRRTVSPAPATAHFTDVPTSHGFFKFVEALYAAGITIGYPDGRFGVNDPVTRGQMAVFLSVALGLYWPNP